MPMNTPAADLIPHPTVSGQVDVFEEPGYFAGWAGQSGPDGVLEVIAMLDGRAIGGARADEFRADLERYGFGDSGFRLTTTEPVSRAMFAAGRLRIEVVGTDGQRMNLPFGQETRAQDDVQAMFEKLVIALGAAVDADRSAWLDGLAAMPAMKPHLAAVQQLFASVRREAAGGDADAGKRVTAADLAPIMLPVGTEAADGSAVIGRQGFVFLTRGGNDVLGQIDADVHDPALLVLAADWVALIAARQARLEAAGIGYVQIIMPEKISVLPACFPHPVATPTAVLALIELAIAHDPELAASYLSVHQLFRTRPEECFRRVDSHLTPCGAFRVISAIAERRGLVAPPMPMFDRPAAGPGDMGKRFFGVPLFDVLLQSETRLANPVRLHRIEAPEGAHVGHQSSWRNSEAPYPGRVVIFGNSFFAPSGQEGMFWWATRLFEEVHYLWQSAFDDEYIKAVQPDWVIGQTVERFLPTLPER